ncbi:MAG: DUF5320 domain-containing protein [Thermoplasmatales archaeon]|nr:DUF5320 domain-containing protein [Thermoplasmatales archaeon]
MVRKMWGYGWYGWPRWPGRGPFSYLPPWQRPGWLFGRGACWWLFNPWYSTTYLPTSTAPLPIQMTKEEEQRMLKNEIALLEKEIERIRNRLKELEGK